MANVKHDIRATSYATKQKTLDGKVLPYVKDIKLDKLTKQKIQDWKTEINKLDISVQTKRNAFREFRAMINYAIKMDYLAKNPLTAVGTLNFPAV